MHSEPLGFSQTEILETQAINKNIVHKHRHILPNRVANQKVGFALSYRLAQPAVNIDNMAERTEVKPQRQIHCRANKFYHRFYFNFVTFSWSIALPGTFNLASIWQ